MPKMILGFTGLIASGKDVSKKYLEEKYGASSHRFSTMLRDILNRLYLPVSRENLQTLSQTLRGSFGQDTLARVIAEDVKNDTHDLVIVEGIRRQADIIELKNLPNFRLVAIDAEAETRYHRVVARNENVGDAEKTYEQFLAEGQREAEAEIPAVMAQASFRLDNNGTFANLYKQLDELIAKL